MFTGNQVLMSRARDAGIPFGFARDGSNSGSPFIPSPFSLFRCLGLRAETKIELEDIIRTLQAKISKKTQFIL
jgi:hypothetical protein